MKSEIHPDYRYVIFNDLASGEKILTRTTANSDKTAEWTDGNTYPVIDVEISAASHPFYTGKQKILDSGGRVARFEKRYGKRNAGDKAAAEKSLKKASVKLDKAVSKGVLHKNQASNRKSAIAKQVAAL